MSRSNLPDRPLRLSNILITLSLSPTPTPTPNVNFFRLPLCTLLATTEPPVPLENHVIPAKNPPTPPLPPPHQYFVTDTMIPNSSDWMVKLTDYYKENLTDLP